MRAKAELERRFRERLKPGTIWNPNPGPQSDFLKSDAFECLYGGAAGGGKALHVDTPIPTPNGWKTMGDINVGDTVFDEDGNHCKVTFCSEIRTDRECFEIVFSDGATVVADRDHLWVTTTASERQSKVRRRLEYRERRRISRERRGTGKRLDLATRNAERARGLAERPVVLQPRTTAEIRETLFVSKGKRKNHAVGFHAGLSLPDIELPIDPYTLGVWLGDGTSSGSGLTNADAEVLDGVRAAGFDVRPWKAKYAWGARGLGRPLREASLLDNKHIPSEYLRASDRQRLALLQGLMDTDGGVVGGGQCEFTTTIPAIRDGVFELLTSLGIKPNMTEGRAMLNGQDVGPKWRMKFLTHRPAFRLARKLRLQKRSGFRGTHVLRYVSSIRRIDSVPVKCIGVDAPSRTYLAGRSMVPTHNSWALVHDVLRDVDKEQFTGLLLRNSYPELEKTLIRESLKIYPKLGAKYNEAKKLWVFPSGAHVYFGYLERDADVEQYQGAEFQYVGFDELTHYTRYQYTYLISRLRSPAGIKARMRATTNPGSRGHAWVKARWSPWVDRSTEYTGVRADPGQILRFRVGQNGEEYSDAAKLTRQFIPARLEDNPKLLENDPEYAERLDMLDPVTREQLRYGRWDVLPAAGQYFQRIWFHEIHDSELPGDCAWVRFWDKAATEPNDTNQDPDWTVGLLVGYSPSTNRYYVRHMVRFRGSPGVVESTIKSTAETDGKHVKVRSAQDPGGAGKGEVAAYARLLVGYDFRAKGESGSKVVRAGIVSAQVHPRSTGGVHGRFSVVRGEWNKAFFGELEAFPDGDHDDIVDALSGAFDWLVNPTCEEPPEFGVRIIEVPDRPVAIDELDDAYERLEGDYFGEML